MFPDCIYLLLSLIETTKIVENKETQAGYITGDLVAGL